MMEKSRVLCVLLMLVSAALCERHVIEWTKEGVQQYRHKIQVKSGDSLTFSCPLGAYSTIWYLVATEQYCNCDCGVDTCLRPAFCPGLIPYSYTVDIERNSEQLGNAQDYQPGRTYFFTSFSTGSLASIDQSNGGECMNDALKLEVEVLPVENYACECEEQGSGVTSFSGSVSPTSSTSMPVSSVKMFDTPMIESVRSCDNSDSLSVGGALGIGVAVGAAAMVILAIITVVVVFSVKKCCYTSSSMNDNGQRNTAFEIYDIPRKVDDSHIYDAPSKLLGK